MFRHFALDGRWALKFFRSSAIWQRRSKQSIINRRREGITVMVVAIDGPSGAGKSTIARSAAKQLGYIYVDTGAIYRTLALHVINSGGDVHSEEAVRPLLESAAVAVRFFQGEQRILLNGEDVSGQIRTSEISMGSSAVSAHPAVRAHVLELQRDLARRSSVIMDGRDIGTVVLPNADLKIYLTADPKVRALRRYRELVERGERVTERQVLEEVLQRDYNDSHRSVAPLRQAEDAVLVDNSHMDLSQSVDRVVELIEQAEQKKQQV